MSRKRTSIIWTTSHEELQRILDTSNTISEILTRFNLHPLAGNRKSLKLRLKQENFNLDNFNENHKNYMKIIRGNLSKSNSKSIEDILVESSSFSSSEVKKKLLKFNLLEYKCSLCGLEDIWNGKKISLQLDHINGINNDNRLENLRLLCPNCHSQTETFSGKHRKILKKCKDCKKQIGTKSTRCSSCASKHRQKDNSCMSYKKKFEITKEELINLITQYPMTKVGEILGVSDNAVRKRCKSLGIDYKSLKKRKSVEGT
jgi:5-methylcytosine-specific restriction endonuclease McrA